MSSSLSRYWPGATGGCNDTSNWQVKQVPSVARGDRGGDVTALRTCRSPLCSCMLWEPHSLSGSRLVGSGSLMGYKPYTTSVTG